MEAGICLAQVWLPVFKVAEADISSRPAEPVCGGAWLLLVSPMSSTDQNPAFLEGFHRFYSNLKTTLNDSFIK